ncbi:hypothetical protein GCM10010168_92460 [Actinoplanes ianthinogenes]|uniref:Uncharacterized protein n=1 Tax=Actinoplanes ianthinogenes TaxID=122358 RepID=A0ABM7LK18_9ACTN|nr:hypothetical protein Aiant_02320 [Actinoplanes ianthinogenes]GGR59012.1 hypothetical protein GCM10010168_92460 [Actinoplanes ianthinogenes]
MVKIHCSPAARKAAAISNGSARCRNKATALSSDSPAVVARNGRIAGTRRDPAASPRMAGILGDRYDKPSPGVRSRRLRSPGD